MKGTTTIMTCLVGATVLTYVRKVSKSEPVTMKPLVGSFLSGCILFAISLGNEDIAVAFAMLVFITSLVLNGEAVFNVIGTLTSSTDVPNPPNN